MKYKFAPAFLNKKLTNHYDRVVDLLRVGHQLHQRSLQILPNKKEQQILDIGCGTGTLTCLIGQRYPQAQVVGIDPDPIILSIAQTKAKEAKLDISYLSAPGEKLPFEARSFDVVISSLAFHHMPTTIKKACLKEIKRVLKPDGSFFLIDIGRPRNLLWKLVYTIEALFEPKAYIKDNLRGQLPLLVKDAGFKLKEARKPYMGIYFWRANL